MFVALRKGGDFAVAARGHQLLLIAEKGLGAERQVGPVSARRGRSSRPKRPTVFEMGPRGWKCVGAVDRCVSWANRVKCYGLRHGNPGSHALPCDVRYLQTRFSPRAAQRLFPRS